MPNTHSSQILEQPCHGKAVFKEAEPTLATNGDAAKYFQHAKAVHVPVDKREVAETWKRVSSAKAATLQWDEIPNIETAKRAVAFAYDINEDVVQLIIDAHCLQLDPSLAFSTTTSLSQVVQNIIHNTQRLEELRAKVSHAKLQQLEVDAEAAQSGACEVVEAGVQKSQCCGAAGAKQTKGYSLLAEMPEESTKVLSSNSTSESSSEESQTNAAPCCSSNCSDNLNQASLSGPKNVATEEQVPEAAEKKGSSDPCPSHDLSSTTSAPPAELKALEKSETGSSEPKAIPKAELQQRVKALAAENRKLKYRKLCRNCKKVDLADSGITFLPCGHFITCEACSDTFDDCPACGVNIMGTVRTYLS